MNSTLISLLITTFAAAALAYCLTPLAARLAVLVGAIDLPGERKIHDAPVPRLGGVAVVAAVLLVWVVSPWLLRVHWVLPAELIKGLGLGLLPVLAVSFVDDIRPVGARTKMCFHLVGACIAVAAGVSLSPEVHFVGRSIPIGMLAWPLSVLWIVGVTNAFNIIDGLDGLAAGLALIAAVSMAAVFAFVGEPAMTAAALVLAGALAGFLPYNTYPARLFLGDTGATAVGFCLAAFALKGGSTLSSGFAALVPVFIMGLPIADTLISMARRLVLRAESGQGGMFKADHNHIHHRLLALGIRHQTAVFILYGTGVFLAAAAFVSMFLKVRQASLFIVALLGAGLVGMHRLGYDEFAFIRRGTVLRMYERPVVRRAMFVVFADLLMVVGAAYIAVGLKIDQWGPPAVRGHTLDLAATIAPLTVLVFWYRGLYRGSWQIAGMDDLVRACTATTAVTILGVIAHAIWAPANQTWSVFLIYGLVSTMLIVGSRASYVVLRNSYRHANTDGSPVLVYGAGSSGIAAVREIFENPKRGLRPVGFIDDDPGKLHKLIAGLPVVGSIRTVSQAIAKTEAGAVLIAIPELPSAHLRLVAEACGGVGVKLFRMNLELQSLGYDPAGDAVAGSAQEPGALSAAAVVSFEELQVAR
ncbi:MAG: hypothetical protein ABJC89_09810 [Acidobacteriota bacterium]